jgi:hypothetical protein
MRIKHITIDSPRQPLAKALGDAVLATLADEGRQAKRNFERTVATWESRPTFAIRRAGVFGPLDVFTSNEIYYYITHGTRPHIIRPKRAKRLRFNTAGFVPKTMTGRLDVGAGQKAGPPLAYRMSVQHPGTDARDFDKQVAMIAQGRIYKIFVVNLARALRS